MTRDVQKVLLGEKSRTHSTLPKRISFYKKRLFCDHVYSLKCMYDGLVLLWPHGEKDGRYVLGGQHGYVDVPATWVWLGAVPREGRLEGREVFRNIWARESWR